MDAIVCTGLRKRFSDVIAVDGLDLTVRPGVCFGLLGPNGAGKTTTIEILEGLTEPDAGTIEILGHSWHNDAAKLRQRLGVQLQESRFADKLTVYETLSLFRSFYHEGRNLEDLLTLLELGSKRNARVHKLSGGQRQRLALACALAGSPELLFLDEPTTGLDPQARLKLWEVVETFRQRGGTVLLTTHYMEEATRLCDRVAIMDQGKIIREGSPQALIAALDADQIIEFVPTETLVLNDLPSLPTVGRITQKGAAFVLGARDVSVALPALFGFLQTRGIKTASLSTRQPTLEDVFVHLTGRHLRDE